jgi:hypothetical protein
MQIPAHVPPEYHHPRWLLYATASGSAFIYACVLLAANVFPYGGDPGYQHGLPFVYMVRESQVPGGLTIFYAPWPLDDPPLVEFRPTFLLLNVLCGSLLTAAAAVIPLYWLRVHRRPLHFGLRAAFGLGAVVLGLLGLFRFYHPNEGILSAIDLFVPVPLLVYVLPGCLIVIAAHRMVVLSARSARRRRWLGIHWLTWLAAVAVGGPLLHYSMFTATGWWLGATHEVRDFHPAFGWPFEYSGQYRGLGIRCFSPSAFVADTVVWLTIVASTIFVVERWVRRVEQGVPMQKRAILYAALAVGIMIWILNTDQSFRPEWYDACSWLLGIASTIYAAEVLIVGNWKLVVRQFNLIAKISLLAGICVGIPLWLAVLWLLRDPSLAMAFSLLAGGLVASAVDAGYRLLSHRDAGISRFIRPDCGGCAAVVPMWTIAMTGVIGGLVLCHNLIVG